MQAETSLRHQRNSGEVRKGILVSKRNFSSLLDTAAQHLKLPSSNTGEHITHSVVVAQFRMLKCKARVASLLRPESGFFYPRGVVRDQHSAASCCNDLVSVEGKCRDVTQHAGASCLVGCAKSFCRILQNGN